MFNISENQIVTMSAGDTADLEISINIGTELDPIWYPLHPLDKVQFSLMEPHQPFNCGILRKELGYEDMKFHEIYNYPYVTVHLAAEDTENLLPGTYYYSIKVLKHNTEIEEEWTVNTIVSKKKFLIIE